MVPFHSGRCVRPLSLTLYRECVLERPKVVVVRAEWEEEGQKYAPYQLSAGSCFSLVVWTANTVAPPSAGRSERGRPVPAGARTKIGVIWD
jgi:hypothetical protein